METLRILLIEDEVEVALAIQHLLRENGAECDHAPTGEKGLVMARKGTYDVIVLDVNLPGIGGLEVAQRLRAAGDRSARIDRRSPSAILGRLGGQRLARITEGVPPPRLEPTAPKATEGQP